VIREFQAVELDCEAPRKPLWGEPCNRCGVCCAAEPCPVAHVFLLQRKGTCRALVWQEEVRQYACGMAVHPERYLPIIPSWLKSAARAFFAKRIAAGKGCDAKFEVVED
jgi:hypothetical protein